MVYLPLTGEYMIIEFKCPYCGENLSADLTGEAETQCPTCLETFTVTESLIREQMDDKLLDPSHPAGYLNNFPPEDDLML